MVFFTMAFLGEFDELKSSSSIKSCKRVSPHQYDKSIFARTIKEKVIENKIFIVLLHILFLEHVKLINIDLLIFKL